MVSSLNNNRIDIRISFDESDDEDYTVVFDKNSFSYKIISINDLKMDSENDCEKINMPLFPSPEPSVSCIDDLDFFKDFEKEFPAIVYNDALTSKSDFSTEPTLCPQHIDEFDLKDETSLSEYDEVEQNVLYFNDLFPFNIIYPDDLKSNKDDDDNEIDMIQSSGGGDMALPPRDQMHQYLRFEGLQYTEFDIADYETRLAKIYRREAHRVQVFDFEGLPDLMTEGLTEEMQTAGFGLYWAEIVRQIPDKGDLSAYWIEISSIGDFLGIDIGSVNIPYLLARYLRLFASGRKQVTMISGGQFVARLAKHFGLLTEERLQGLTLDDTWAWVAPGPERQPDVVIGAPEAAEDAPIADEGASAVPEPVQAPQPPPPAAGPAQTMAQRLDKVEEDVHEIRGALGEQREILDNMARDFSRFSTWAVVGLSQMMSRAGVRYTNYAEFQIPYERRTRRKTDGSSTSIAQQDEQQPDL
ncbi:hypothetical protein Tco_0589824 [Tanacetum coccineum]